MASPHLRLLLTLPPLPPSSPSSPVILSTRGGAKGAACPGGSVTVGVLATYSARRSENRMKTRPKWNFTSRIWEIRGLPKPPFNKRWFTENDLGPKPGELKPVKWRPRRPLESRKRTNH